MLMLLIVVKIYEDADGEKHILREQHPEIVQTDICVNCWSK